MKRAITCLVAACLLAGCGTLDPAQPPIVRFGEEACVHCRMIISDDRFAAAIVERTGDTLKFDDVGCLVEHEAMHLRPDVVYWVRGFDCQTWLLARDAAFVYSTKIVSPMNHGLAAFPDEQAAEKLASDAPRRTLRFGQIPEFASKPR
jgi:copper chaperone NosL